MKCTHEFEDKMRKIIRYGLGSLLLSYIFIIGSYSFFTGALDYKNDFHTFFVMSAVLFICSSLAIIVTGFLFWLNGDFDICKGDE